MGGGIASVRVSKTQNDAAFCAGYKYGAYEIAKQDGIQSAKREIFTEFYRLSRAILSKLLQILSVANRNMYAYTEFCEIHALLLCCACRGVSFA